MQQIQIKFYNAEQVRCFVNVIDKIETDFMLGSDDRIVNAKSILGVFALDLSQPQTLSCSSNNCEIYEILERFIM